MIQAGFVATWKAKNTCGGAPVGVMRICIRWGAILNDAAWSSKIPGIIIYICEGRTGVGWRGAIKAWIIPVSLCGYDLEAFRYWRLPETGGW